MKVGTYTNVNTTGKIRLTKGFHALIFKMSRSLKELTNETISITVARANSDNIEITPRKFLLKNFISMLTYGETPVRKGADGKHDAMCAISTGNIVLEENDVIVLELNGLVSASTYDIYTVEAPVKDHEVFIFEENQFLSERKVQSFKTGDYDVIMFDNVNKIEKVSFHYENGNTTDHHIDELQSISNDVDVISSISDALVDTTYVANQIVMSIVGVEWIEFTKTNGLVTIYMLDNEKSDSDEVIIHQTRPTTIFGKIGKESCR